ncbi:MAG: hypothetical protein GF308_03720 [Candidatus Heimdallarchaeota archaeon]|nr:hypothetical protein [Candidatus Heimdallarchaeota archaeon]
MFLPRKRLLQTIYSSLIISFLLTNCLDNIYISSKGVNSFNKSNDNFMRGVSFTGFSKEAFLSDFSNESIEQLKTDGGSWIAICFWWFIDDLNSTKIYPDFDWYSCSNKSICTAIGKAKELGLNVMLKPMVDSKSGEWRAYINPTNAWFDSYKAFITSWARFAENYQVEMLCIGCEFSLSESYSEKWRAITAGIRAVYSGKLTYAANHDAYNQITWWDELDYIGIDAYYQLTDTNNPSLEELLDKWDELSSVIGNVSDHWDLPVVFTEIGYRSIDGCNRWPWDWQREARIDFEEQRKCYEAVFRGLWGKSWWAGIFWWDWTPYESTNWQKDDGYTPQYKPAESVLSTWYSEEFGDSPTYSWTSEVKISAFIIVLNITGLIIVQLINKKINKIPLMNNKS